MLTSPAHSLISNAYRVIKYEDLQFDFPSMARDRERDKIHHNTRYKCYKIGLHQEKCEASGFSGLPSVGCYVDFHAGFDNKRGRIVAVKLNKVFKT